VSREDVPIWHTWMRVGPTRDRFRQSAYRENFPTVDVTCAGCLEFRPDVSVALVEGTAGDIPQDYWPGRCNLAARDPADTAWVSMTTDPPPIGQVGRGLIKAVGHAILLGGLTACVVLLLDGRANHVLAAVAAVAAVALGSGITAAVSEKKPRKGSNKKG